MRDKPRSVTNLRGNPEHGRRRVTVNGEPIGENDTVTVERDLAGVTRVWLNGYGLRRGTVVCVNGQPVAYARLEELLRDA